MLTHNHAGVDFREFVRQSVKLKSARSYLEVGVRDGSTISMVECPSIGVDPAFALNVNPVGCKNRLFLFQMTSDVFFRDYDPREIFGSPLDVVFLDGLHQFEYLLRDFMNCEAVCHGNSLIILDDCLPVNVEMTERAHDVAGRKNRDLATWWTGDVWKLLPILTQYRPDLRITPVDASPTGLICVTNLDPESDTLRNNYQRILDDYMGISMDEGMFVGFHSRFATVPASRVLQGFDYSLYVGH